MSADTDLTPTTGCLFFCHGARDPAWREPFEAVLAEFARSAPDTPAVLAFLELMKPDFEGGAARLIEQGVNRIHVVPLFLAPGGHTRGDLPGLVETAARRWPAVSFEVAATLTEDPAVREAIVASARAALSAASARQS